MGIPIMGQALPDISGGGSSGGGFWQGLGNFVNTTGVDLLGRFKPAIEAKLARDVFNSDSAADDAARQTYDTVGGPANATPTIFSGQNLARLLFFGVAGLGFVWLILRER